MHHSNQVARGASGRWLGVLALVAALVAALSIATPARADAPTVTDVDPATGPSSGGTNVTITGTNFTDADEEDVVIEFGGVAATTFNVLNDTTITATTPPHAPGAVDVEVTVDGSVTAADAFTYHPFVTSISPDSGSDEGGDSVVITGGGFDGTSTVEFNGEMGTVTASTSTTLTVTTPEHAVGTVDVVVTTNGASSPATAASEFTFGNDPIVLDITPETGPTGGGTAVIIDGVNLTGATSVTFGGTPATFTVVDDETITTTAPAHAAGLVDVVVTTPFGSDSIAFTYSGGGTVPTVTALSPDAGPTSGGTVVTITGTNLTGATAVSFGGTAAQSFTVDSATQITAVSPAHAAGDVNVTVTTPAGTSATAEANEFTYGTTTGPLITGLSPTGGPTAGGNTVTITGTGFTGATAVSFGGTPGTNISVNAAGTQITVTAPSRPAGPVFVTVTTPLGTSGPQLAARYTYGSLPAITGVSPSSGPIAGGTVVTITGSGFTGATAVHFGTVAATNFTVNSDTSITATAPAGAAGDVFIRVTTPVGQSAEVAAAEFTYQSGEETVTYTLQFRWTLLSWLGIDGITITAALSGTESPDDPDTNNILNRVTAIFRWNATASPQRWEANFPGAGNVPGANDFTTFENGRSYFIAITSPGPLNWTVRAGD